MPVSPAMALCTATRPASSASSTSVWEARWAPQNGKPHKYLGENLADTRALYLSYLAQHAPDEPYEGPLYLSVEWNFKTASKKLDGKYKISRPDTDNLNKLFKDCMTKCGYWKDDSQVVVEQISKKWAVNPFISVMICSMEDK